MKYLLMIALLFTATACSNKSAQEKAEQASKKTEDSLKNALKLSNDRMAEKIGDEEADAIVDEYQQVVREMDALLEKEKATMNKVGESSEYAALNKRSEDILKRRANIEKRLAADRMNIFRLRLDSLQNVFVNYTKRVGNAVVGK
jgi:hypothetical protein